MKKFCSILNCENPSRKRTWCEKHYSRWKTHGNPETVLKPKTVKERLLARHVVNGECWEWTGSAYPSGYGSISYEGNVIGTHQASHLVFIGEIPEGLYVDHRCRNRICINPEHLRLLTHKENMENRSEFSNVNSSGHRGISLDKESWTWRARVNHNNKTYYVGRFVLLEDAIEAVKKKRNELYTYNDADRL